MIRITAAIIVALLLPVYVQSEPSFYEKRYEAYTVWLDCNEHGPVVFSYELGNDTGNESRSGSFKTDPSVPTSCQPDSGRSYRTSTVDPSTGTWDRGHLVPANHMDHSKDAMAESFYVTNILPQQSRFNQSSGAWFKTEEISECYRDITTLTIWGGVIWGNDSSNDFFINTHGIKTPDYWWKVIYRHDNGEYLAWLFPNHMSALAEDIDDFLLSLDDLKGALEYVPDFGSLENSVLKNVIPTSSWPVSGSSTLTCEGNSTSAG